MKPYLKLKQLLKNDGDKIEVKIVSKEPDIQKTFGGITKTLTPLNVIVGGKGYIWEVSEDQKNRMKEGGCGATFWIVAYKASSGYIGFNYVPQDDVTLNYMESKEVDVPAVQDDFQDKVSRGAAWNLAFQWEIATIQAQKGSMYLENFLKEVASTAEKIAPHQKAFVNGEQDNGLSPMVKETIEEIKAERIPDPEPPPEKEDFDLPF